MQCNSFFFFFKKKENCTPLSNRNDFWSLSSFEVNRSFNLIHDTASSRFMIQPGMFCAYVCISVQKKYNYNFNILESDREIFVVHLQ